MAETGWVADALVIFGITRNLARKMTFPALYRLEWRGTLAAFARELGVPQPPYERLLYDALTGDDRLFVAGRSAPTRPSPVLSTPTWPRDRA